MKHVLQDGGLPQHCNPSHNYKVSNNPPCIFMMTLDSSRRLNAARKRYKLGITRHQTSTSLLWQPLAPLVTTSHPAGLSHTCHCYQQAISLSTLSANFSCSCKLWTFFNKYTWHGVQVAWHSIDSLLRVYFGGIPTSDSGKKTAQKMHLQSKLQHTYLRGLMLRTRAYILSSDLSRPYASAAAVGSLITLKTFKPEICPASFVA